MIDAQLERTTTLPLIVNTGIFTLLGLLIVLAVPVVIIVRIVKLVRHRKQTPSTHYQVGPAPTPTITDSIVNVERMPDTEGHPRLRVTLTGGSSFMTAPGSMVAFAIENRELQGRPIRFTLDQSGNITHAQPV